MQLVEAILSDAASAACVRQVIGNHVGLLGRFMDQLTVGQVTRAQSRRHQTGDGRKLLVVHAGTSDPIANRAINLCRLTTRIYAHMLELSGAVEWALARPGRGQIGFSRRAEQAVKGYAMTRAGLRKKLVEGARVGL
ncbi:MAG: hypothetical protein HPY44_17625 [Armatimonadetes bacterium]|nr:hypothetical protein [Armatimonadota bacterium]